MTDVTSVASAHTLLSFRLTFSRHQLIGWVAFLNDAKLHTICPWRYVGICLSRIIKAFSWVSTSGKWIHVKITLHKLSGQFKVIAVRSHPTGQMRMRLWRPEIGLPDGSAGRESACNAGDPSWIPGLGSSPREGTGYPLQYSWASLGAQMVKNPPAMPETWVLSLCWEDPLEEGMAAHSSIFARGIPWAQEPDGLQSIWPQRVGYDWATKHTQGLRLRAWVRLRSPGQLCLYVEILVGHRENGCLHERSMFENWNYY